METKKDSPGIVATKSINLSTDGESKTQRSSVKCSGSCDKKQPKYTITIDLRQIHAVGEHHMFTITEHVENTDTTGSETMKKLSVKDGRDFRGHNNGHQELKGTKDLPKRLTAGYHGNMMSRDKTGEQMLQKSTSCEHQCNKFTRQVKGHITQSKATVGVKGQGVLKVTHLNKQCQLGADVQGQKISDQDQDKTVLKAKGLTDGKWNVLRDLLSEANANLSEEAPDYNLWLPRKQQKCLRKLKDLLKPVNLETFEFIQLLMSGKQAEMNETRCKTDNDNIHKVSSDSHLISGIHLDQFMFNLFLEDYGYHVTNNSDRSFSMENIVKEMLNDDNFLYEVMSSLVSCFVWSFNACVCVCVRVRVCVRRKSIYSYIFILNTVQPQMTGSIFNGYYLVYYLYLLVRVYHFY